MAPTYCGIDGVVRKLKEWPVGINGVVHQQKEVWAGVDGVKRKIFSAKKQFSVVLTGNWMNPAAPHIAIGSVTVNGSPFSGEQTLMADENSTIVVANLGDQNWGKIRYNGNLVSNSTYSFVANQNFTISCYPNPTGTGGYGALINITPEG